MNRRDAGKAAPLLTTSAGSSGKCLCRPNRRLQAKKKPVKLSTRGRYAVMAMADLARHADERRAMASRCRFAEIAGRQEHFALLSGAIVRQAAPRRPGGQRARARRRLSPGAAGSRNAHRRHHRRGGRAHQSDPLQVRTVPRAASARTGRCLTHDLWEELGRQIEVFLESVTLADVLEHRVLGRARSLARRRFAACGSLNGGSRHDLSRSQRDFAAAPVGQGARCWPRSTRAATRRRFMRPAARARARVEDAREEVARLARRQSALRGVHQRRQRSQCAGPARRCRRRAAAEDRITRLFVSAIEHDSVRANARALAETVPGLKLQRNSGDSGWHGRSGRAAPYA